MEAKIEFPISFYYGVLDVAKPELGTKRVCPETGKKFYDLHKDPIISPYTGKKYLLSYFEKQEASSALGNSNKQTKVSEKKAAFSEQIDEDEDEDEDEDRPEFISLEEADAEAMNSEKIPDINDDDIVLEKDDSAEEDPFLEEDEDDDDAIVGDIISVDKDEL